MEEQHERLFDLIESKSFEELSKEEQAFVLEHLSEEEYTLQRKVIAASAALEYPSEEPLVLVPQEKKRFLNRSIPLYQALLGAASIVLLFLVIGNKKPVLLNWNFSDVPLQISLTNGSASMQTIHDTIVKEIPGLRPATKIIHDTIAIVQQVLQQPEKRLTEVTQTLIYPELNEKLLESRSQSLKDDQAANLLPPVMMVNTLK